MGFAVETGAVFSFETAGKNTPTFFNNVIGQRRFHLIL
jgi:hypothetical protein